MPPSRYEDLDEIYSRALEPLVENMREVVKFRYYMEDSIDVVERAIKDEKAAEPNPNPEPEPEPEPKPKPKPGAPA